jgi:hypothetical protein
MSSQAIVVTPTDIRTEEGALADAAARGLFAVALDVVGAVEDWHWHEFAVTAYILGGEASADYDDGVTLRAGAGNIVHQPAGTVHKDVPGVSYRAVFAFDIAPQEWTQPVNKPVA